MILALSFILLHKNLKWIFQKPKALKRERVCFEVWGDINLQVKRIKLIYSLQNPFKTFKFNYENQGKLNGSNYDLFSNPMTAVLSKFKRKHVSYSGNTWFLDVMMVNSLHDVWLEYHTSLSTAYYLQKKLIER